MAVSMLTAPVLPAAAGEGRHARLDVSAAVSAERIPRDKIGYFYDPTLQPVLSVALGGLANVRERPGSRQAGPADAHPRVKGVPAELDRTAGREG